jgi:hypothetical protein
MYVFGARSPFILSVNEAGQTQAKLELFLWRKGDTEPVTPNYVLIEGIPSINDREILYNLSPFVSEFIDITSNSPAVIEPEDVKNWLFVRAKIYAYVSSAWTLVDNFPFVAVNGYSSYLSGANFDIAADYLGYLAPLKSAEVNEVYLPFQYNRYIDVIVESSDDDTFVDYTVNGVTTTELVLGIGNDIDMIKVPLSLNGTDEITDVRIYNELLSVEYNLRLKRICEAKYTPVICDFINQFGGWDFITFFKNQTESVNTESKTYGLYQKNWNYDPSVGQKKEFNFKQTKTVKLSTGYVPENYNVLIESLMASQTVLIGGKPALVKSKSQTLKTQLNNRLINYEIEFELNYNLINDMQ